MKRSRQPQRNLPPGIEVHWLPVNQAYLVTFKGQRVAGPMPKSELDEFLKRFDYSVEEWNAIVARRYRA